MWDINQGSQDQPPTRPKDTCTTLGGSISLLPIAPPGFARRPALLIARAWSGGGMFWLPQQLNTMQQQQLLIADILTHRLDPIVMLLASCGPVVAVLLACVLVLYFLARSRPPQIGSAASSSTVTYTSMCLRFWACPVLPHMELSVSARYHKTRVQHAIDVKNLLFLARLEFSYVETGCFPHYFQYKEVIFLFFPQNLSQTPIDHILNVCRELFCSAAPGVSCLLQRGAAVCGINFKNRSDQSGAKYRFWANQNTTR